MNTWFMKAMACATGFVAASTLTSDNNTRCYARSHQPMFRKEDVQRHSNTDETMWVSFRDGVYDVTDFARKHIGGIPYIELAAGGPLEPFWAIFRDHLGDADTLKLLESMRIGTLDPEDRQQYPNLECPLDEYHPFTNDPKRDHAFIPTHEYPYFGEPKNELLGDSFITPSNLYYIRNHFPVPEIEASEYEVHVHVSKPSEHFTMFTTMDPEEFTGDVVLSLDDLKNESKFCKQEYISTMQCSGNRGDSFYDVAGLIGNQPYNGFISTAKWGGVLLKDVLIASGYDPKKPEFASVKYVQLHGYDTDLSTIHYAVSLPIKQVMNEHNDVLVAYEMNGEDLPRDHGYPCRVVVPGTAGCRSCKWLHRIILTEEPVDSQWQERFYQPYQNEIYDMPITSVITRPRSGDTFLGEDSQPLHVQGFAWSGGGRGVLRVEVSIDGGVTWMEANLERDEGNTSRSRQWAWSLWSVDIPCDAVMKNCVDGKLNVFVRAMDTSFNSQPASIDQIVNGSMYVNNSWHHITMNVPA